MSDASAELPLRNHLKMAFATPVVAYPWPDSDALNRELAEIVLAAERRSDHRISRSNVGGWHSTIDFLDWDAAPIRVLRNRVTQMTVALTRAVTVASAAPRTFNYRLGGWANVSRHGNYNACTTIRTACGRAPITSVPANPIPTRRTTAGWNWSIRAPAPTR